jgi:DNA-binding transcriptional regulator LsrR (DeoR family)
LSVVIAFPAAFTDERALAHAIQRAANGTIRVRVDYNCIICEQARDVVELASQLSTMFGVGSVAIANKVSSNFSDLTAAIVEVGSKVITSGERFYVKVVIQPVAKCEYVSRDIEFTASSMLAGRLASIKALPAKTEKDASRVILTVIGKKSAYVCIQLMTAPGGLIAGSQGRVLSSIHDSLSFLSCLTAAKTGFNCTGVVLPYVDKSELEINAKLVQLFAARTGRKKQTILAMPINVPAKGMVSILLKEKIISKILMQCQNNRIVFPLNAAVHPIWFIEHIIEETVFAGKTPFAPLLFLSNELETYAKEAGIELLNVSAVRVAKEKLRRYRNAVDSEARLAIKHTKRLELKIGPNYFHDIIDSI